MPKINIPNEQSVTVNVIKAHTEIRKYIVGLGVEKGVEKVWGLLGCWVATESDMRTISIKLNSS